MLFINIKKIACLYMFHFESVGRGHDRMVVGFSTTYAIHTCHHKCCEFESRSWRDVFDTTVWDKVCQ
jgi:hypothetical protein